MSPRYVTSFSARVVTLGSFVHAQLHSELLKATILKDFVEFYGISK